MIDWSRKKVGAIAFFACLALACSDADEPQGAGGAGGSIGEGGSGGDTGGGGGGGGEGERCDYLNQEIVIPTDEADTGWEPAVPAAIHEAIPADERPASCGEEFGWVSKVRGWIAAPGGEPIPCGMAQFCIYSSTGIYECMSPEVADDEGVYTVNVPEHLRCVENVAMRTILPLSNRATSYCPVIPGEDPVARLEMPSILPFAMPTEELPPLGDEDEAREVAMHDGLTLQVTPAKLYWGGETYENLSGRRVPTDAVGLCGGAEEFDGLYAFYPEDNIEGEGFPFTIENATEIAPGTRVEFLVLGGLDCKLTDDDDSSVPEAEWAPFGEGEVSPDGALIEPDPGVGLPCLTWLAYRIKE